MLTVQQHPKIAEIKFLAFHSTHLRTSRSNQRFSPKITIHLPKTSRSLVSNLFHLATPFENMT